MCKKCGKKLSNPRSQFCKDCVVMGEQELFCGWEPSCKFTWTRLNPNAKPPNYCKRHAIDKAKQASTTYRSDTKAQQRAEFEALPVLKEEWVEGDGSPG